MQPLELAWLLYTAVNVQLIGLGLSEVYNESNTNEL